MIGWGFEFFFVSLFPSFGEGCGGKRRWRRRNSSSNTKRDMSSIHF